MPSVSEKKKAKRKAYYEKEKETTEKEKKSRTTIQKRYNTSEKGSARKVRYQSSEKGRTSRAKYEESEKGTARQARYAGTAKRSKTRNRYDASEAGRERASRYAETNPNVIAAIRQRYKAKAAGKRVVTKKKKPAAKDTTADSKKQYERQRLFVNLLPSREYSYIGGRAIQRTGRIVAQQKMVRNLSAEYQKRGAQIDDIRAERLVQIALNYRNDRVLALKRTGELIKDQFEEVLKTTIEVPDATLVNLCGAGSHTKAREPYFFDAAYRHPTPTFESYYAPRIRKHMQVAIYVPPRCDFVHEQLSKKLGFQSAYGTWSYPCISLDSEPVGVSEWPCDYDRCWYPANAVQRLIEIGKFFDKPNEIRRIIANELDVCSSSRVGERGTNLSTVGRLPISEMGFDKLGHPISCLPDNCVSNLLFLRQLAVHFKYIAPVVRQIYKLIAIDRTIFEVDKALITCDVAYLEQLETKIEEEAREMRLAQGLAFGTSDRPEEHLIELPYFKKFNEEINCHRSVACASCRRLFFKRQTHSITLRQPERRAPTRILRPRQDPNPTILVGDTKRRGPQWNDLWAEVINHLPETDDVEGDRAFSLCNKCYEHITVGVARPAQSFLNNLLVEKVPPEISKLNEYERICTQLAKCFAAVYRLGAVGSKLPHSDRLRKVKGQILYYPLPITETIRQLEEASANAPSMHILVNSVATKNGLIWQSLVNLDKVRAALDWLKANNELYKEIQLDAWIENIRKYIADPNLDEESAESLTQEEVENARAILCKRGLFDNAGQEPMLQAIDEAEQEAIIDSYTIHPLEQQKPQYTDLQVFQMQHLRGQKIDTRHAKLDLACFPALYPYGRFGERAQRDPELTQVEFIKNRLLHEDPRFRRDHQFIFHALWESELRQIAQGVNQTLKNRKRYDSMTVGDIVRQSEAGNQELEANLSIVFSKMRGSPEYWIGVKRDLLTMIRCIGSPTWFLTLSAAEFEWEDISNALRTLNSDLPNLDRMRTSTLTSLDPVMTQTQFHHRFVTMFNEVILHREGDGGPLGLIFDYWWRIEYQSRGMPHYHILLWVKNAPKLGVDEEGDRQVGDFITKHVTCRLPDAKEEPLLYQLVNSHQRHHDNNYCLRRIKTRRGFIRKCRFGYPRQVTTTIKFREALSVLGQRSKGRFEKRMYDLPRRDSEKYINDYNPIVLLL